MKPMVRLALTVICVVLAAADASAQFYEVLTHEDVDRTYVLSGYFSKPGSVIPGQMIFSVERRSPGGESREKYFFVAQTGQKTFEMSRASGSAAISGHANIRKGKPVEEKIIVDFAEGDSYPLPMSQMSLPNCTIIDRVLLRIISLKEGQLEYQVILPDCFRKAIGK